MIDDKRKQWLRGAYLDRIMETAQAYAAGHTPFVDAEWESFIADEFGYLRELSAEDQGYLREQAGLEAFRRIVAKLSAARDVAFAKLRADNSDVIAVDASFRMDLGWISLLQHAADRVRTYPSTWKVQVVGGKEKFGCLVLHVACDYSARGCRSEVERLREEVRLRSLGVCDICGERGRLRIGQWAKTVCDKHAAVLGEFREDDGVWSDPWKWSAPSDEYPAETAELLRDMDPVRPRPKEHVVDSEFFPSPIRATPLGRRVDDDTWSREGREQEMLIEFGFQIIDTVQGACVKEEYLDKYVRDEVAGWREYAVTPLTESDLDFLRGYLRALINEEYERIRIKQQSERADRDNE